MAFQFSIINTPNNLLNRIQQNIQAALNQIVGPFIGGSLLSGISLAANTPLAINHGLGRQPQLWVVCDQTSAAEVYRTAWNQNQITLEATANCTIAIWVN